MSDAQAEAERIVMMAENELAHRITGVQDARWHRDRLVAALTATIEVNDHGEPAMCCLQAAACPHVRLAWVLSALRQTDGEDT